jgi:PilZ domain
MATYLETTAASEAAVAVDGLRGRRTPLFVRIRAAMPAVLVDLAYGRAIHGQVENLSVGGMFFRGADTVEVGTRVLCALIHEGVDGAEELYCGGTVVHRHDHGVGIAFDEVAPRAFMAISRMIAEAGCFRMRAVGPRCPAAPREPRDDRRGERRRPRPRKARMKRWEATHRAA